MSEYEVSSNLSEASINIPENYESRIPKFHPYSSAAILPILVTKDKKNMFLLGKRLVTKDFEFLGGKKKTQEKFDQEKWLNDGLDRDSESTAVREFSEETFECFDKDPILCTPNLYFRLRTSPDAVIWSKESKQFIFVIIINFDERMNEFINEFIVRKNTHAESEMMELKFIPFEEINDPSYGFGKTKPYQKEVMERFIRTVKF